MRSSIVLVMIAVVCLANDAVRGQASTGPSQGSQAILDYQLTVPRANQLITAMEAMTKYFLSRPDHAALAAKSAKMTPAERLAQFERDPKAMAIARQNGLTAQEYLVGVPALRMALMAAQGLTGPNITVSPANLAFAKANMAQLKPKWDAANGITSKH
jgi:hypothetical protein